MNDLIKKELDEIRRIAITGAKNVLNLSDVALLTGMSKSTLYKKTGAHSIPHYKPNGKMIYFDRKEIEDWMKQNRVATKDEIDQMATEYITNNGGVKS